MCRRALVVLSVVFVIAIACASVFIRFQSGGATVFRRGHAVITKTRSLYVRPLAYDSRCRATTFGEHLNFDGVVVGTTAADDEFPLRVRFDYAAPHSVATGWPAGDWCSSLQRRIASAIERWSASTNADALLAGTRAAEDSAADSIARDLAASGINAAHVSARIELPAGFDRLRSVPAVASLSRHADPVIFIGLDGADWELLDGYMAAGVMPNLRRLVATGAGGVLETEHPPLSPIVWTTMMTGVSPLDHQILDFARFNPATHEKEPITSDERRVPAIWNMATYGGKRAAVFGLWATYAAEPVHGINASDRLFTFLFVEHGHPAGVIWPPTRKSGAEQTISDAERAIDITRMRHYLPSLSEAEYDALLKTTDPYSEPAAALHRILVETEIYRRLSTEYLAARPNLPDLTILYLQGTDTIGHVFAPFAPPKQPEVSERDFERYSAVAEHYFREIDALLGDFLALADQHHATLVIASDHGFHWREGRPTSISSTATATAAKWHRKEGMYVLWGPGIGVYPNHPLRGGVRQVCGTLLALAGLPAGSTTAAPLAPLSTSGSTVDYRQWFTRAAPPPPPSSNAAAQEDLAKLRALGYIGSAESTRPAVSTDDTKTAGAYNNEGLILRQLGRTAEAVKSFERALVIDPRYASAMWNESETFFDANRDLDRSDQLLVAALRGGLADGVRFTVERSIAYDRTGRSKRSLSLLQSAVGAVPNDPELHLFRGRFLMERHDCASALDDFRAAEQLRPNDALAFASAGAAQMCLGDNPGARESFTRSLAIDPNQPELRRALQ